jgi:ligand-binding sensor domain-containing protein
MVMRLYSLPGGIGHTHPPAPQTAGSLVRFFHLSQEDGLSQNAGLAFLQDSRGFLWIGTQDGLNRYDGHTFTVYKNDPDNPTSLSYNSINALMEDQNGQIWIST